MELEKINNAFNEALEAISTDDNETYSVAFVQHHEEAIATELKKLKLINTIQTVVFLGIFIFFIFNQTTQWLYIPYTFRKYEFFVLWALIIVNSFFSSSRLKKIRALENKLLLIDVYKKIVD